MAEERKSWSEKRGLLEAKLEESWQESVKFGKKILKDKGAQTDEAQTREKGKGLVRG